MFDCFVILFRKVNLYATNKAFFFSNCRHIIGVEKKKKKKTDLRVFAGARVSFLITNICLVGMAPIRY
ncbi:unnamed protein product, partial [Brassica oleracea var. botrytis]